MTKYFSASIDKVYQLFTNRKTCSLLLDKEIFDGVEYKSDEFFKYSQNYFNKPELFYKKSEKEDFVFELNKIQKIGNKTNYSFPTPYLSDFNENNTAFFKLFSENNSKTLLIFSPGWARPNLKLEEKICRKFLNKGIDCVLPTKPFHQERTPDGFYSGELFISANQLLTVANFRQYVAELRNIVDYYREKYVNVGIVGMSSGGFQAGLLTNTEEVDFYFPFITGAELGSITWDGSLTRFTRKDLEEKGVNRETLNKIWAIADQKYLGHNCKAKYIKQYISRFDNVVPTEYQFLLNKIYGSPKYVISSAHTSVFFKLNDVINDMVTEIQKITK